jgi:hypothetical protein
MTGDHFQMGDGRPLLDIIRRDEHDWQPMIPSQSQDWETFCLDFTRRNPVSISQLQLKSQLELLLGQLKQLAEPPQDQPLMVFEKMTSDDFTWEHNVSLVCYSCAVTTRGRKVSELWNVDLELLTKFLCPSPMFLNGVTSEELMFIIGQLRRFFCVRSKEQGQGNSLIVDNGGLAGSKRPSREELNPVKRATY